MKRTVLSEFEHEGRRYLAIGRGALKLSAPALRSLSPAELEVALLWARGASIRQIAAARGVAFRTVTNQLAKIYRKLGRSSRTAILELLESSG